MSILPGENLSFGAFFSVFNIRWNLLESFFNSMHISNIIWWRNHLSAWNLRKVSKIFSRPVAMALEFRCPPPELLRNWVQIFFCPSSFARRKFLNGLQNLMNLFLKSFFNSMHISNIIWWRNRLPAWNLRKVSKIFSRPVAMALEFRRPPPELLRNWVQIFFCPSSFALRKFLNGLQDLVNLFFEKVLWSRAYHIDSVS